MPAILEGDSLALWLNPKSTMDGLPGLLSLARDDHLEAHPVSTAVNDAKNEAQS